MEHFSDDFRKLISYIIEKCANAKIIIIGMFWTDEIKDNVKKKIADEFNVEFIKLSDKYDNSEFYSKQGNIVYGADCNVHRIVGDFVAKHPGDKGMEVIASEILKLLYF